MPSISSVKALVQGMGSGLGRLDTGGGEPGEGPGLPFLQGPQVAAPRAVEKQLLAWSGVLRLVPMASVLQQ